MSESCLEEARREACLVIGRQLREQDFKVGALAGASPISLASSGFAFCILTCAYCYHQVAACTALWRSRLSIHPDASTMNAPGVNNVCTYPYGPDSPEIKTFARGNRKNLEHVRSRSGRARGRMAATLPHTAGGFFIILIKNHETYAVMLQV